MPKAADSTGTDLSGYQPAPVSPMPPQPPPTQGDMLRSRVMLASMPGISSGPDSVLRQFNGGRATPRSRIFVP